MIKKKYYWKSLTNDGLLKEPEECGPYYSTESLNGYGGFDSEEEAYERLEYMSKAYKHGLPSFITLITDYEVSEAPE